MDRVEEFVMSGSRVHGYSMSTEFLTTQKQLCINLNPKDGALEIPDFFVRFFMSIIKDCEYAIYNLHAIGGAITRRMIKGALSDFMRAPSFRRLSMVHMASGDSYYGLPGVIMDSDFHILMMTTYDVIVDDINSRQGFRVVNHNCRVSPRVFERADKNIEKMIIKKAIPFCASHVIASYEDAPFLSPQQYAIEANATMKVLIEDIDKYFIHTATPPKVSDNTVEIAADILRNNIENVLI